MTKTFIGGVAALALASAAGSALAQTSPEAPAQPRAHGLRGDTDGDGRLSQSEFVEARLARLTAADANGDGSVTPEERAAARTGQSGDAAARARRPIDIADARVKLGEQFVKLDTDHDGFVSAAEQRTAMAAMRERGQTRRMRQPASPAPASE